MMPHGTAAKASSQISKLSILATRQSRLKSASFNFLMNTSESTSSSSSSDEQLYCLDTENWFLLSPAEKTRQYHIQPPWNSCLAKIFHLLKQQHAQSRNKASIYTKYQFLWWHRLLPHGMSLKQETHNQTLYLSLEGMGEKENLNENLKS